MGGFEEGAIMTTTERLVKSITCLAIAAFAVFVSAQTHDGMATLAAGVLIYVAIRAWFE